MKKSMKKYLKKNILSLIILLFASASAASFLDKIFPPANYSEKNIDSGIFPDTEKVNNRATFSFDPVNLRWAVYNKDGKRVGYGKAVGGKDYCPDIKKSCRTVVGAFTVFRKEDADCTSKTFPIDEGGGAPMPHCMFFHEGYAIHGSDNLPNKNASHGCVRVSKKAAEWISKHYIDPGARVVVLPY